jgi:hypothetical protein
MKKIAILAAMLPGLAWASPSDFVGTVFLRGVTTTAGTVAFSVSTTYPNTAVVTCTADTCSAPTAITEMVSIDNWVGFSVTVVAESGKTLTAVGTIDSYVWDSNYAAPSYLQDLGLTVSCTGKRRCTTTGVFVAAPRGWLTCVPNGVVTSATGALTLYINGTKKNN